MKIIRYSAKTRISEFRSEAGIDPETLRAVATIVNDVRNEGDSALLRYCRKFEGNRVRRVRVPEREIRSASKKVSARFLSAVRKAILRVWEFHSRQRETSWLFNEENVLLGQLLRPVLRAGVYVPGGSAPLVSTVYMTVVPAKIAGVKEVALASPAGPDGRIDPHILTVCDLLGVYEVYRMGGAQAIAALAYGTETVKPVDKIVGPGNRFVVAAKKMVFGKVGIDSLAGPSEVCVLADDTASARWVAADLLSQAEHDPDARCFLVTNSRSLAERTEREIRKQKQTLPRRDIVEKALEKSVIFLVSSMKKGIDLINELAPEHLEIVTKEPMKHLDGVRNAGCVFLGEYSPEPIGDYVAGTNHTLPTGGQARFSSALGVYDFYKRVSLIQVGKSKFADLASISRTLARVEGLDAHFRAIDIRKGK